jgi:hypothetical protein
MRCYKSLVGGFHHNTDRFVPIGRLFTSVTLLPKKRQLLNINGHPHDYLKYYPDQGH